MAVRKVCKWCVVILLLVGVSGVLAAYWFWSRSDELLRTAILDRCAEVAPQWNVSIDRARFDWNRRVHLYHVALKPADQREPIVVLPEIVIHIDRERFAERQEIDVQRVRLLGPTLNLVRDRAGNWNWKNLPPLLESKMSLPECEIDEANVWIRIESRDGAAPARLLAHHGDLQLVPSGKRQFLAKGELQIDRAGTMIVDGRWDVDAKTWTFGGRMKEVPLGRELIELAAGTSPELRTELAHVQARLENLGKLPADAAPRPGRSTVSLASRSRTTNVGSPQSALPTPHSALPSDTVPDLGVSGTLDVSFRIARRDPDADPEFKVWLDVKGGQVTNSAIPFPLRDLKGKIYWDNRQLIISDVTAANGVTLLELAGRIDRQGAATPGRLEIDISNLVLDERLRNRLPAHWRKFYDPLGPTGPAGRVDIRGTLYNDGQGGWRPENFLLTARDGTATYTKFPYPIHSITGTIRQRDENLEFDFEGRAGQRPVTLKGLVKKPGPGAESAFDIRVEQLPLDETLLAACNAGTRETLTSLDLQGTVDVLSLYLRRPPGLNRKFQQQLIAQLYNASLEYDRFPYRLTNLSGAVTYSSPNKTWKFIDLAAEHGTAKVTGSGSFSKEVEPGRLELTIAARDADFNKELQLALPRHLQKVWDDLSPTGVFNMVATVDWIPGSPPVVSLPEMHVIGSGLVMRVFPYPFSSVEARLSYANGIVEVQEFSASHDQTKVQASGYGEFYPAGDWKFRIVELTVDDLVPDRVFRRALPDGLQGAFEKLDPRGPLSLTGKLEFRGTGRANDSITAAWDIETVLTKATLNAGLELKNVNGVVTARGTWDGYQVKTGGDVYLDSVEVLDHQVTQVRGPYRLTDQRLVVGSDKVLVTKAANSPKPPPIDPVERITARAVGGWLTLDGVAVLADVPSYHVIATMSQGSLEKYARRYLPGVRNVRGVMNGWIDLQGRGESARAVTGRGQLQVSPAALYELPIVAQVFNVLTFVPSDRTAFKYALVNFTMAEERFQFPRIDLAGDAISLRGRGTAGFDGALNIDFYSMLSRNQLPIPLLKPLLDEATKGWVGVKVRGNVGAPEATITAVPTLDGAMKRFLAAVETLPRTPMPRLIVSPLTPAQAIPLSRPAPLRMLRPR